MKRHDIEYCGIICRHTTLQSCLHPDLLEPKKFEDGKLTRNFPEWCPLPDENSNKLHSLIEKYENSIRIAEERSDTALRNEDTEGILSADRDANYYRMFIADLTCLGI